LAWTLSIFLIKSSQLLHWLRSLGSEESPHMFPEYLIITIGNVRLLFPRKQSDYLLSPVSHRACHFHSTRRSINYLAGLFNSSLNLRILFQVALPTAYSSPE
jgi:hypothetical protein